LLILYFDASALVFDDRLNIAASAGASQLLKAP
jgi:hypothetical protein